MSYKIAAFVLLAFLVLVPFRYAFLTPPDLGPWATFNFIMMIMGLGIFSVLISAGNKQAQKKKVE